MDLERCEYASEHALLLVTSLYSASLIVSNSFSSKSCNPMVPFGECVIGEIEGSFEVRSDSILYYLISFVVAFLAGAWSDSHGRRRRPLIFLPIIGQIVTDGLNLVHEFWYWPSTLDMIFTSIVPGLFVGRNMFWIGTMSYVSENSLVKSRTLKLGTIITTYTISSLLGSGIVAFMKMHSIFYRYDFVMFLVPMMFNIIAILVGYYYVKDTSDLYNENIVWLRPKLLIKGFMVLFQNKLKTFAVSLAVLIICESLFVTRIEVEYPLIMTYLKHSIRWYGDYYVYFNITKMLSIIFGSMCFIAALSSCMKVSDLAIGLSVCCLYIVAAVLSVVPIRYWQYFMILATDFCHGAAITITASLTSKMVEIEELGRLNSIQTSLNSLFIFGMLAVSGFNGERVIHTSSYQIFYHIGLVIFVYVILMLPITYTFMILYSKYKEFWGKHTSAIQNKTMYTVSQ